jgi:hypothetical protein
MLLDSGDMKMEHVRTMMKLIETIVNIIKVETKKLKINKKDKNVRAHRNNFHPLSNCLKRKMII